MNVDLPDVEVVHRASVYDSNLSKSRGKGYRNQANSLVEVLIRPRISTDGLIRPRSSRCSSCDQFFFFLIRMDLSAFSIEEWITSSSFLSLSLSFSLSMVLDLETVNIDKNLGSNHRFNRIAHGLVV